MLPSFFCLAAFILVSAQTSNQCVDPLKDSGLSDAARQCFDDGVASSGCTSKYDTQCLCNSSAYEGTVSNCIIQKAPGDIPLAAAAKKNVCATPTPAPAACLPSNAVPTAASNSSAANSNSTAGTTGGTSGGSSGSGSNPNLFPNGNPHTCNSIRGPCSNAQKSSVFTLKVVAASAVAACFALLLQ